MKRILLLIIVVLSLSFSCLAQIQVPKDYFGFTPGDDNQLFNYEELIGYLQKVDEASDQLQLFEIGKSPEGRTMYVACLSTTENIKNIEKLKDINKQLATNPDLNDVEKQDFIDKGKVFVVATMSMHSNEVAPAQSVPLIVHDLLTTTDPEKKSWLNDVVLMIVPNHNPDGMNMVVEHFKKYKGTKYDGSSMPGIYHKYVGHDNNRDFVILSQTDSKAISSLFSKEWFPQVMVEKHQMGSNSARYFVPPMHDPISENVDEGIWGWTWVFGSNMSKDLTRAGLKGVSQHYLFDDYWPGSTETCIWKNTIGMLTEAASVKYAKPIYIEPTELKGYGKGLSEYEISINMPDPWEGGWWHLSDIVDYEIESTHSILKTASKYRVDILKSRAEITKKQTQRGKEEAPYFFIFPAEQQNDLGELADLVSLLDEHGVTINELGSDVEHDGKLYKKGDIVVSLAQPFRPFIKEVLEKQNFPERHYTPGGELIKPYDITSWSLPLHRGINYVQIDKTPAIIEQNLSSYSGSLTNLSKIHVEGKNIIFDSKSNYSYKVVFYALKNGVKIKRLPEDVTIEGKKFVKGSFVIPNIKTLGDMDIPKGFEYHYAAIGNESGLAVEIGSPKIALVETYFHDMDAGWTRFIFDTYNIAYEVIRPEEIKTKTLENYDVIVFPDADNEVLMQGKYKSSDGVYNISSYPPEYTKGIEKEGLQKLAKYIDNGGKVLAWGRSARLFIGPLNYEIGKEKDAKKEEFQLPVNDVSKSLAKNGLYSPGTLLNINLSQDSPLTYGMGKSTKVFTRGRPVFTTSIPNFDMDRRTIGWYPKKDILASGYADKEEQLANKVAMVWLKKGKGQVVMYGFYPQFRASTPATYKLLFNGLLLQGLE